MESLIDKTKPWGIIKFIHKDGLEHTFYTAVNEMTGDRLSSFDDTAPWISDNMKWIKSIFRDIRAQQTIVSYRGTVHFK